MEAPSRVQVMGTSHCHATRKNTMLGVVRHRQLAWALTLRQSEYLPNTGCIHGLEVHGKALEPNDSLGFEPVNSVTQKKFKSNIKKVASVTA